MTQASPARRAAAVAAGRVRSRRLRLDGEAPAAAAADIVATAITQWQVPADRALATVLASDLVINAAMAGTGEGLTLMLRFAGSRFRAEVLDPSASTGPPPAGAPAGQAEPGLRLAADRAADSGCYQTPAGRAVYYVLEALPPDAATGGGQARGTEGGGGDRHPPVLTVPAAPAGRPEKPQAYVLPQMALDALRHQLDEQKVEAVLAGTGPLSAADQQVLQDGLYRWGGQFDTARARMMAITARLAGGGAPRAR